jgi:hypothetical protein
MKFKVKNQVAQNLAFSRILGITLMELLVAMGLASFMLAGIWRVYFYFRHAHDRLEKQLITAYELQLVTSLLRNSIRRAGFTPCMPLNSLWTEDGLYAYQIKDAGLTLNRMSEPVYLTQVQDNRHLLLTVDPTYTTSQGLSAESRMLATWLDPADKLRDVGSGEERLKTHLIADCYHAELIHIKAIKTSYEGQQVELSNALHFNYLPPVYLGEWLSETYYMRYKPYPALMVKTLHADVLSPEVLAFHVKEKLYKGGTLLQITLGLFTADEHQLLTRIRSA